MTFSASDDLTDLFTAQPADAATPMRYRQGVIQTWNPVTLQNTVRVGTTTLTDLPVLGLAEAASFAPGTTVGLAIIDSTWAIIGRFVIPNTNDALDAITQLGQKASVGTVLTSESTSAAPYVDLTTPGPVVTVRIPASGKLMVILSCNIGGPAGTMAVQVSGDTTIAPNTFQSVLIANAGMVASSVIPYSGLPVGGICTFTAKYGSNGVSSCTFSNRSIFILTL